MIFRMTRESIPVRNRIYRIVATIERGLTSGKKLVGQGLVRETKFEIKDKSGKSGRMYMIRYASGRRRRHQASAPGESHANLTGALRNSVSYRTKGDDIVFGYGVGPIPAPAHARTIEFGGAAGTSSGRGFTVLSQFNQSKRGGRIAPRPSIMNGIRAHNRDTILKLQHSIDKAVKR